MIKSKWFHELTTTELYEILRSRAEIFVVEQNCVYQDLDGKDYESLQIFVEENGRVVACLRAFMKDEKTVQMGRVLSLRHGEGYGAEILKAGIREIRKKMNYTSKHSAMRPGTMSGRVLRSAQKSSWDGKLFLRTMPRSFILRKGISRVLFTNLRIIFLRFNM